MSIQWYTLGVLLNSVSTELKNTFARQGHVFSPVVFWCRPIDNSEILHIAFLWYCMQVTIASIDTCACIYQRHSTTTLKKAELCAVPLGRRCRHGVVLCHGHERSDEEQSLEKKMIAEKVLTPLPEGVRFCVLCGCGDGILPCPRCEGRGVVLTRPGGAGVAGAVGQARCKICSGLVRW